VIAIFVLISRSKLVPDFTVTLHFIHLVITSLYSHSIPQNWLWWALQVASAALMASLGIWSCQYRELRPINFGGSGTTQTAEGSAGNGEGQAGDEEQGYSRGRGRGRGRDGAGAYEMVEMKSEDQVS
jgi:ABC-type nickel/cobalt efflux system permease component RcnA